MSILYQQGHRESLELLTGSPGIKYGPRQGRALQDRFSPFVVWSSACECWRFQARLEGHMARAWAFKPWMIMKS